MKVKENVFITAIIILLMFTSCKRVDVMGFVQGEWYGSIERVADGRKIGKSVLKFEGNDLKISSNVLYAPSVNHLRFIKFNDGIYFFENDSSELNLQITLNGDSLLAKGNKFRIEAIKDSLLVAHFLENYKERNMPIDIDSYLFGYWKGTLFRTSDNKVLSDIAMSSDLDSLSIYANAISGKKNVSWTFSGYDSYTKFFEYHSPSLNWKMKKRGEEIMIEGNGCYALLFPSSKLDMSFFKNKDVSTNPNMYLSGNVYKGELKPLGSYAILSSFLKMYMEVEILDDERIRIKSYAKSIDDNMAMLAMLAGENVEKIEEVTGKYVISNNILIHKNDKFEIRENGNVLVVKVKEGMAELRKGL